MACAAPVVVAAGRHAPKHHHAHVIATHPRPTSRRAAGARRRADSAKEGRAWVVQCNGARRGVARRAAVDGREVHGGEAWPGGESEGGYASGEPGPAQEQRASPSRQQPPPGVGDHQRGGGGGGEGEGEGGGQREQQRQRQQQQQWERAQRQRWQQQQQWERAQRQQQRQQRQSEYPPGGPPPAPDITLLTQREIQALLPIGATGQQYAYFWGGAETAVQRLGVSFLGFVATVNLTALLAVPSVTFFLWAPVALAARRNSAARRGRHIGLWRATVLHVSTREAPSRPSFGKKSRSSAGSWMLSLLVGDYSGATVELRVPLQRQHTELREGDEVEMVVGSDESYFDRFEAVREAYFPATGTWVGEYPFLDRRAMPSISGRIARDAEARDARVRASAGRGDGGAGSVGGDGGMGMGGGGGGGSL